jgi:hypothetical protein
MDIVWGFVANNLPVILDNKSLAEGEWQFVDIVPALLVPQIVKI